MEGHVNGQTTFRSRRGRTFTIRPVTPDDLPALVDFVRRLSPETRYRRFSVPLPDPPREEILRHLGETLMVDAGKGAALIALDGEEIVGSAHFVRVPGSDRAEAAVVVRDDRQGEGIGTHLLRRLADLAREQGIRVLYAYVQPDNERVLRLVRKARYPLQTTFEHGVMRVDVRVAPQDQGE